jgi:hypothetical protein
MTTNKMNDKSTMNELSKKLELSEQELDQQNIKSLANYFKSLGETSKDPQTIDEKVNKMVEDLFNELAYKYHRFGTCPFIPEKSEILYKHIDKVKITIIEIEFAIDIVEYFQLLHSNSHELVMQILAATGRIRKEYIVYFDFPFYVYIKVDDNGGLDIYRKKFFKTYKGYRDLDSIVYNSSYTIVHYLDIITTANFIKLLSSMYFGKDIDFLMKFMYFLEIYKINGNKLAFNDTPIDQEKFRNLYKHVLSTIIVIPIK